MDRNFALVAVFTDLELNFHGNTAAVIKLDRPVSESTMRQLAADFNQPATTFLWEEKEELVVRWFAPDEEIGLCGHGSLAAFAFLDSKEPMQLRYKDGLISGTKESHSRFSMILDPIESTKGGIPDAAIQKGLNTNIVEYCTNNNKNIVIVKDEETVRNIKPDFAVLRGMDPFGIVITAPGESADFVSRTFVPKVGQLEDPATGSSHAALVPFWSKKLNKTKLTAYQLSPRGGKFICELKDNKVILTGEAKIIATGKLH